MTGFIGLTKRNLMIYFKDIFAVIFSLLTSIIVFVLYLAFLKNTYVSNISEMMKGLEAFVTDADVDMLVSSVLLVGIVGSALVTVPFSCLTTIIKDKENKIDYDISATPIRRWQIIFSYFVSAVISAFVVTAAILSISLLALSTGGSLHLSAVGVLKGYGIVFLGSVSATAIFMIPAMFFRSSSVSSAFFGILSAASGFIIGAYMPLSQFSETVRTVCNLFPATQITVLFRKSFLDGELKYLGNKIGGADNGAFVSGIKSTLNFESSLFGKTLSEPQMYIYILGVLAISLVLMVVTYKKTYKRT